MSRPSQPWTVRIVRGISRLRHRREVEWLVLYLGAAWILYEAVGLTVESFDLPPVVVRITAIFLALGAIISVPFAHWYELTARELQKTGGRKPADVPGVPDMLEPALARSYRSVSRRSVLLAGAGSTLLFSGFFFVLWNTWAVDHERAAPDSRVSVVVFPFRTAGAEEVVSGEGIADLLIVTLDGTPGIRVADPGGVWGDLRPERGAPARSPEPDEALRLGRRAGGRRLVTGTVVPAGTRLDVSARVYDSESGESIATLKANAHQDSLAEAVHRLAIDLVATVWERDQLPAVPEIDRFATSNADALKAYLEAKSLARRGLFDQAEPLIENAVSLDSTFALAHLEHFNIRSRILYLNGEPFIGLRPIIEKAMVHRERLTPRNRMRIEAHRALDDTDGSRAAFLFERILSIDSLDIDALHGISYTFFRDGWQLQKTEADISAAYDRLLSIDSTSIAARAARARLALASEDPAELQRHLEALRSVDTTSVVAQATLTALNTLLASETELDSILPTLAERPLPIIVAVARELMAHRPAEAERFLDQLLLDSRPVTHNDIGTMGRLMLWLAEGRVAAIDSLVEAGAFGYPMGVRRHFLTALMAGVGDSAIAAKAVPVLKRYLPADSLSHFFYERPAWLTGWAVGAYEATFGDSAEAAVWRRALEGLPGGGTPRDYRAALSGDIAARVAARRGDMQTALADAHHAYDNWQIHSANSWHDHPEPAIRFELAELHRAQGMTERAEWLYRSFVPPYGWLGFYTARSSFELGRIEETRGNRAEALKHYLRALRLWERGDPGVVGDWLARTQEGIERLRGELQAN